jgi:hypothetical protein
VQPRPAKLLRPFMRLPPKPLIPRNRLTLPSQPSLSLPIRHMPPEIAHPCSARNQAGKLKQQSIPTTIRGVSCDLSTSHANSSSRVRPDSSVTLPVRAVQTPAQIFFRCPGPLSPDQSTATTRCNPPSAIFNHPSAELFPPANR